MMSRRKRADEQTMDGQDLFSKLPEPLIIEILSLLELKDAVKTGLLSKSWKNYWTQVYNIVLKYAVKTDDEEKLYVNYLIELCVGNGDNELALFYKQQREIRRIELNRWISSVDCTLAKCTTADINRFCLIGFCDFSAIIDKWISFALDRNVKILKLTNYDFAPDRLFQSLSITKMDLDSVKFSPSATVHMSSLKCLLLESPTIDDVALEKLVMGCPVLENVVIKYVRHLRYLNIMSPSVKRLKLHWFEINDDIDFLSIKAPWLQELEISERFNTKNCHLVDVSSLAKTTLTFRTCDPSLDILEKKEKEWELYNMLIEHSNKWILMVTKLLNSLSYVGELTIGTQPIQALLLSKLSGTPSPLFMCKHLSIETHIWKFDLPGIACLLESTPHLETLLIKVVPFSYDPKATFPLYQTQILFRDGDPHLNMPNGKFPHLKNVNIEYCQRSCHDNIKDNHGGFFDFALVEYILKSAVVLEKLVLFSSRGWSCSDSTCVEPNCSFQYVPSLCSKLISTFPSVTGNEAAEWEFNKSKNKLEFTFSSYA